MSTESTENANPTPASEPTAAPAAPVAPPAAPAPTITVTADDPTWAMLAHLSMLVLGFLGPLLVMLIKGKESELVNDQAKEALNFSISAIICFVALQIVAGIMGHIFWLFGLMVGVLLGALGIGVLVLVIMAGLQAKTGARYRYPFCLRLVK